MKSTFCVLLLKKHCGIKSLCTSQNVFFFHGFISFIKYTYQWNRNLTCCGLESPSTDGTFVCTKRIRFWSRPSAFKGQGMCISYSDWAWTWFVSRQKHGICPPYTASRPSLGSRSLQFIVYGSSYPKYGSLKINPLIYIYIYIYIYNVEVNNEWSCASGLPKCLPFVQGEDAAHLLLCPQYALWIGLISVFFIFAFYVSPWVSLSWHSEQ